MIIEMVASFILGSPVVGSVPAFDVAGHVPNFEEIRKACAFRTMRRIAKLVPADDPTLKSNLGGYTVTGTITHCPSKTVPNPASRLSTVFCSRRGRREPTRECVAREPSLFHSAKSTLGWLCQRQSTDNGHGSDED
jgi:hypothetical protein